MNSSPVHAVLLQPPPGDVTGPYPALPYIKAYAEQHGHRVTVRDLAIEALTYLTSKSQLHNFLEQASGLRARLEETSGLSQEERQQYQLLVGSYWLERHPESVGKAQETFKDARAFRDYTQYNRACKVLDSYYRLLSAVHFPTEITSSEYPTAQMLNSTDRVFAHCNRSGNPYASFYEDVLFKELDDEQPLVVGISMEFASQSVQALVLGKMIKDRFPGIHVTMGGAYLSQWLLLMDEPQFSWLFTSTDSVVCGEGEQTFTHILERVGSDRTLDGVPNLVYKHPSDGTVRRFETLEYPDVSELPPPDFSDLDLRAYLVPNTVIPYAISRGCYWGKCVFCQNRYGENRMRPYQTVPVEKALSEMAQLRDLCHSNHFNFSNDVVDPRYLKRFSRAVMDSGEKFVWNTDLRAEKSFDKELCELMAGAGLNSVAIGLESGCAKTLEKMNKGKEVDQIKEVMKSLYDSGIATQAMGIFGFPGETETDAETTVRFLEENADRISYYVMGLLMVLPGSRMHENPQEFGVDSINYEGNELMAPQPIWTSKSRISSTAVNRLYDRLGKLEATYAIHEYPYVGALSTNHSFLYFQRGPDVLKRLKEEENKSLHKLMRLLEAGGPDGRTKKLKTTVPRLAFPIEQYRPPFFARRPQMDQAGRHGGKKSSAQQPVALLVSPVSAAVPINERQLQFLRSINGRKNLKAIFGKYRQEGLNELVPFLHTLVSLGLVVL